MRRPTTSAAPLAPTTTVGPLLTDRLRAAIVDGTFSPGERLVELQLSDRLGEGGLTTCDAPWPWPNR